MKKWLLIALVATVNAVAWSQSYPEDREKFVKALIANTNDYLDKKDKDFLKDEFTPALTKTMDVPDSYFKQMVATCNLMESKRLKPYPDIYKYVYSVYSFVKNKQPQSSFSAWHSSIDKLLDAKNIKKFTEFINTSAGFFSQNLLEEDSNNAWYFYGAYVFEFTDRPLIKFTNGRLVCGFLNSSSRKGEQRFIDSLVVNNTSGMYDPVLKKWEGNGGTIDWMKVGIDPKTTYAEVKTYNTSMKSNALNIDTVLFISPYFPNKKIAGKLTDRAVHIIREADKVFPSFISYEKRYAINNILPDIDYVGGFSLQGASLIGLGNVANPAMITFKRNGKKFMVTKSDYVSIEPKRIKSNTSAVAIYIGESDSIIHPGLNLLYVKDSDMVELTRGKAGISMAPFRDSYHQLDWYVQKVQWTRSQSDFVLTYEYGLSQEQRVARFESTNFYDGRLYDKLQGMEQVHPLAALFTYCYKYDEFVLPEGKAATALGKTIDQAKPLLLELSGYGFVSYDTEGKIVTVNPKTQTFVEARSGKRDYDNLSFVSDMRPKSLNGYSEEQIEADPTLKRLQALYQKQNNERRLKPKFGTFSLSTLNLNLDAVDRVGISEAQASFVLPDSAKVVVKKNRDFDFSGWASAGKMEIHTITANYNYAANKINLVNTDISFFRVKPLQQEDGNKSIAMQSALHNIVGEIVIDDPTNRAGLKKNITNYPILKSTKATKVYYNYKTLFRGAYDSTRFYYTVLPFTRDSLDNFNEKKFRLQGELVSAGIFPVIKEPLRIMPDYSFGFSTQAPPEGHVFYGTKAKYANKIVLSNNGLQGSGIINFVHSTADSKAFTFLPDSTVGYAKYDNKPIEVGVQFPDVTSPDAYITYVPRQNVLKASSTPQNDLVFFNGEGKLRGTAIVRPEGMTGYGIISMQKANLGSDLFKFKRYDVDADTAVFNLKNTFKEEGESELAFKSNQDLSAHVSFKDRKGEFKSNQGESTMTFDVNKYICRMDAFTWLMDQDEMELSKGGNAAADISINSDLNLPGPNFFSIHPGQDSLQFLAPKARFSLKEKTIYCSKVEFLDVADARIFPDSMEVTIRKNAYMDPLLNSKIIANYVTKYHQFINANTVVTARRKYTSEGDYPYYDADSMKTVIHMDKIWVDSSYQTNATGTVKSDIGFKLNKYFDYYGGMHIFAANQLITFEGATRINHNCDKFAKSWMSFKAEIDPKNIQIPVNTSMKTLDGDPISAGIVWRDSRTRDSIRLYPTFLSALESKDDPIFITASGLLQYDFNAKEFQIGSKEKLLNRNEAGNFVSLHTESCSMEAEGVINMGMDYGDVSVDAVGKVSYNQNTGATEVNATMRFNLPLDKGAFESVGTRIVEYEGSKPLNFDNTNLEQALLVWADRKTADKVKSDYTLDADKKIKRLPDSFEKSIVVTGIHLISTPRTKEVRGLMSNLESASIVNLYGKPVMRQVVFRALFEQIYSQNGDHFAMMMQVPGGPDYLLDYSMLKKDGTLNIVTNDSDLAAALNAIKEDKRKSKNFLYQIATNSVYLAKLNGIFE